MNFELRRRANRKGPDENSFHQLANAVENFTTLWLDPLRYDESAREEFGDGFDEILKDAIELDLKKVRGLKNGMTQRTLIFLKIYFIRIWRQ